MIYILLYHHMLPCHTRIHFKEKTKPNVRCLYCLDWRSLLKCFTTAKKAMKIQASLSPKECVCKQTCQFTILLVKVPLLFLHAKTPSSVCMVILKFPTKDQLSWLEQEDVVQTISPFCSKNTGGKWGWFFIHVFCCQNKTHFIGKKTRFFGRLWWTRSGVWMVVDILKQISLQ